MSEILQRLIGGSLCLLLSFVPWAEGWVEDPFLNPFYLITLLLVGFWAFFPKKIVIRILFSWVFFIFIMSITDLILRPWANEKFNYRPHEMFVMPDPAYPSLIRYIPQSKVSDVVYGDLGAMLGKPEYHDIRAVDFQTDQFGFRNAPATSENEINTLVLGDSFTAGIGVGQKESWPAFLDQKEDFQVYNLGMPGGLWQSMMHLQRFAPQLNMSSRSLVIWMVFLGNDLDDNYYAEMNFEDLLPASGVDYWRGRWRFFQTRSTWKQAYDHWFPWFDYVAVEQRVMVEQIDSDRTLLFSKPYYQGLQRSRQTVLEHHNYELMIETLLSAKQWIHDRGWELLLVLAPAKVEVLPRVIQGSQSLASSTSTNVLSELLYEFAREEQIAILDLGPDLTAQSADIYSRSGQFLWWLDDSHWNVEGHRFVAGLIENKARAMRNQKSSPEQFSF